MTQPSPVAAIVFAFVANSSAAGQALVPAPARAQVGAAMTARPSIRIEAAQQFRRQAEVLERALDRTRNGGAPDDAGRDAAFVLNFVAADFENAERYRVSSTSRGLKIEASAPAGMARACATLLQCAILDGDDLTWPELSIDDAPDFGYRSFMVDMGRNPHRPATLHRVLDLMWFYKLNVLQLHLSDDQICSWPSTAFPKLQSANAGWTLQDFRDLERAALARGIAIVPELDVPGHSSILRREYPEVFGKTPTELATSPAAQRGVETLLGEMADVFASSPYVHVGGDEAYGVPEDAQRDFINRLNRFVKSRGKRCVVWEGPKLGEGDNKVDSDVLHINWRTINFPAGAMLDAGYEVINAAWEPHYIVDHYPRTMFTAVDLERCYAWQPTRFAHVNHGMPTFAQPHDAGRREGILGFCVAWWEGREENLVPLCLPRLAAIGAAAWNGAGERDFAGFLERQRLTVPRLAASTGITLPPLPMADAASQSGNLAFGARVRASAGGHQPHFGPQRLTNGIVERFDHFLGFPTKPEPLDIVIELAKPATCDRIEVHETAVGESYEVYQLFVSLNGKTYDKIGASGKGTRGNASFVEHRFEPRKIRSVRVRTEGCHGLTFPSFSRLTEVRVLAADASGR